MRTQSLRIGGVLVVSALALCGTAAAQNNMNNNMATSGGATLSAADRHFIMEAAEGGLAEVQLGKLAKDKGMSDDVKQFGQKMIDDHSKANSELTDLAQRKGLTVPTTVSAKDQREMDHLAKLTGAAFDKEYMRNMVKDHVKDVSAFKKEAQNGKDADLTAWAQKTLPVLEGHLSLAKTDDSKLKSSM